MNEPTSWISEEWPTIISRVKPTPLVDDKIPAEQVLRRLVKIEGVGPNAPTVTNEDGGSQSECPFSFTASFPAAGVMRVGRIIKAGMTKYPAGNWRKIPRADHIDHAIAHLLAFIAGDTQDDHLGHAATRILFAVETE